jgi:hypothetical protein
MIDLLNSLSKFQVVDDREGDIAFFKTHIPSMGQKAYLNVIYKPAARDVLCDVAAKINMPAPVVELLTQYNGAILYSGALSWYGVVRRGQLLNRSDPFSLPPYNIETEGLVWPSHDRDRLLRIGGYSFDGSLACIDRNDLHIDVFHRGEQSPYFSWACLEDWLNNEIHRLSDLFDSWGKRLVDESKTLP